MIDLYLMPFLGGTVGGVAVVLVFYGILTLKLFRLQFALSGVQQALLTIRNQGAVNRRWDKHDKLEQEILAFKQENPAPKERFANDPLPW
jgi:hypothetical protein